jgi:hypothetical protein
MSNSKKAVQEIKNLMKQFGFISDEVTLMSFKLEDNTILQAEKLEVGKKIVKINDAFEQVALENGSYRLIENFNLEVKEGLIVSVKEIFVDAKLVDGTVVKVEGDSIVEGAKVVVVTPDAEIPAPDGIHSLDGGDKIETKDGIIVKYEEAVAAGMIDNPAKMEDVEVPVEVPAEVAPVAQEVVDAIVEAIVPLMQEVKVLVDEMKKMKEGMKQINSDFNSFKKQPAAKKIADGKVENFRLNNNDDVLEARLASLKSLQNK